MVKSLENDDRNISPAAAPRGYGRVLLDAIAEIILRVTAFIFGFFWWVTRWSFAVVIFLAIMAAAGFYVFNEAVAGGEYVQVPDVFDMSPTQAERLLADAGLDLGPQKFVYSEKFPENRVIQQVPAAGEVVRVGRKVYPTVSRGPEAMPVPDVQGLAMDAARTQISEASFAMGSTARIASNLPADTVIGQDPSPGLPLMVGGEIHLLVSAGNTTEVRSYMPNLRGMAAEEAVVKLMDMQLTVDQETVVDPDVPEGIVTGQNPVPGILVRPGQRVAIQISAAPKVEETLTPRTVEVTYIVPFSYFARSVRIDAIGPGGSRSTVFPKPERDYVNGQAPKYNPGAQITQPFTFSGELTVEIFLDGEKVKSYYYKGDAAPQIMEFETEPVENPNA